MTYRSFANLKKQVNGILQQSKSVNNCVNVIKLCRGFQDTQKTTLTYKENSINQLIKYEKPDVETFLFQKLDIPKQDPSVIRTYLVEKPIPESRFIFDALKQNNNSTLNMTALRQLLYRNKDIETSISLIEANKEIFEKSEIISVQKKGLMYFAGVLSFHGLVEMVILGHQTIHALFDIYFFYAFFLIFYLRGPGNSEVIAWRPGVSQFQKYFHNYDYQMSLKVMTAFKELFTTNVSNFHLQESSMLQSFQKDLDFDSDEMERLLHEQLRKLGLMMPEDSKGVMFKEYWETGGENFEWTEPDKDPVEFLDLSSDGFGAKN